jgi:ribosomal protein L11 methyltransferase
MAESYWALTLDLADEHAELAQSLLWDSGALGLEVRDREAPPMPGVRGPAPGEAILVAFFPSAEDAQVALEIVKEEITGVRESLAAVEDQDWSQSWKALIKSTEVGRLWVGPPWEKGPETGDKVRIWIEPKMAFGTGDHPTTALCLAAVDNFLSVHPGASVLDVGTGTGVLAIAAKKLGAAQVVGIDNDEISVVLARENAQANATLEVELSGKELAQIPQMFDLVVANILANALIELAPAIAPKVGIQLTLAGVLAGQADEVERAYRNLGLKPLGRERQGDWVRLDLRRG